MAMARDCKTSLPGPKGDIKAKMKSNRSQVNISHEDKIINDKRPEQTKQVSASTRFCLFNRQHSISILCRSHQMQPCLSCVDGDVLLLQPEGDSEPLLAPACWLLSQPRIRRQHLLS